ncbi:hypothetical protein AB0E62_01525 [Streptomyces sp. NPDC038707]|uniref:hypothetical protein n=1 Tax=Streptomyces sp. NPDC038707 TaxID=3154329 RepID=UPI0033F62D34
MQQAGALGTAPRTAQAPAGPAHRGPAERQHAAAGVRDAQQPVADPARREVQRPAQRPVQGGDGGRVAAQQPQRVRERQQPPYSHHAP